MSKHVDQRVVEMRFDNEQFEKNVKTSMSTLDKLKAALKIDGAEKSLDKISTSAKKFDMSNVANAAESVRIKFSAMQVVGITALTNIANTAVNAGKRMVKSLTVDNVASGWNKLQQKANSMSTLISQGFSTDLVEKQLEKLNWFSDETSYNFTDMIDNISKFTATGQKLDDSVTAMQGIALWAAKSGQNAQKASGAMYQLSQALGSGVMRKEDWKSIQNASMDTDEFRQIALDTAVAMKKLKKTGTDTYVSLMATSKKGAEEFKKSQFADSLTEGRWFDTEVMMEIYKKYSTGADQVKNILDVMSDKYHNDNLYAGDIIKAYESYQNGTLDSFMKSNDISGAAAKELAAMVSQLDKFGMSALKAGQEYRTFGDVIDATKDAVSTKMMGIFETILGNVDQQKKIWTAIGDKLYEWLVKPLTSLQATLSRVMDMTPLDKIKDKLSVIMKPAKQASDAVNKVSKSLSDYNAVVDKVIRGDYGTWQARWDKLEKEGYDWATVQNMVNEKLGDSTRHATKFKLSTNEAAKTQEKATNIDNKRLVELTKLNDEELKNLGFTKEQISAIHDLRDMANKLGMSVDDLINKSDDLTGRWLLFDSFKNIGKAVAKVFGSIGEAWRNMFPSNGGSPDDKIFNVLAAFHRLTSQMIISDEKSEKLTRTFNGVFAILDLIRTIAGFGLKVAFTVLSKVFGFVNVDILDITASVGDAIVAFRDWVKQNDTLVNVFEAVTNAIASVIKFIARLVKALWDIPAVQNGVKKFASLMVDTFNNVSNYLNNLFTGDTSKNILDGLVNGISSGSGKVVNVFKKLGDGLISAFKKVLGIHSPSKVFYALGGFIVAGLLLGIKDNGLKPVTDVFYDIFMNAISYIKSIPWGSIIATGFLAATFYTANKAIDAINSLTAPCRALEKIAGGMGSYFEGLGKKAKGEGILKMAEALAMLVASVIALTFVDEEKLKTAVLVVASLAAIIGTLTIAVSKLVASGDTKKSMLTIGLIAAISVGMALLAYSLKKIGEIKPDRVTGVATLFGVMAGALTGMVMAMTKITLKKGTGPKTVEAVGKLLISIAAAMVILALVCRILGKMKPEQLGQGLAALTILVGLVSLLVLVMKMCAGKDRKMISSMDGIAKVFLSLAVTVLILGKMSVETLAKGLIAVTYLTAIVVGLMAATRLMGNNGKNAAKTIAAVSGSIAMLGFTAVMLGMMPLASLAKGVIAIAFLSAIVVGLMAATKLMKNGKEASKTLIYVAGAIAILSLTAAILGIIPIGNLAKGLIAVTWLSVIVIGLMAATKLMKNSKEAVKMIISITVCLSLLAAAVAALSFIDTSKLAVSSLVVGWLGGIIIALMYSTKLMKNSKEMRKNIITMTACLVSLGAMTAVLSMIDTSKLLGTSASITLLAASMAAMMYFASKIDGKKALPNLLIMAGMMALMGGIVAGLAALKVDSVLSTCIGMSVLLLAMTASILILSNVTKVSPLALLAVGLMTLIVAGLAVIFKYLKTDMKPEAMIPFAVSLSLLLVTMSASLIILGAVGNSAGAAVAGMLVLALFIAALIGIFAGVGALMEKVPSLEAFIDKGIPILAKLGEGIGLIFGSVIKGFADAVLDIIPMIGSKFSEFWTNIQPFIEGVKSLDPSILENIAILAGAILAITAVELLNSVASFLTGSSSMSQFALELVALAPAIVKFAQTMAQMTDAEMEALSKTSLAVKYLCQAADAVPKRGGLVAKITGENSLVDFATELIAFAPSLKAYAAVVSKISPKELDAITLSNKAIKGICEVANKVPKHGGWLQAITGDNSLTSFAEELKAMAPALVEYGDTVSKGFTKASLDAVNLSAEGIGAMCKVAKKVPNTGGLVGMITGDNSLSGFAEELKATAPILVEYANKMLEMPETAFGKDGTISKSAEAIGFMCKVATKLPKDGGFLSVFSGSKKTLKDFTKDMKDAAPNIVKYAEKLSELSDDQLNAMVVGTDTLSKIAVVVSKWPKGLDTSTLLDFFGVILPGMGESIYTFSTNIGSSVNWTNVDSAILELSKLGKIAVDLKSSDGFGALGKSLKDFAKEGINDMLSVFNFNASEAKMKIIAYLTAVSKTITDSMNGTGNKISSGVSSGINNEKARKDIVAAFSGLVHAATSPARVFVYKAQFAKAGAEAAQGFTNGIKSSNMLTSSQEAAARLAVNAVMALKKTLDIHSPSRVTYGLGKYTGMGFVNAMYDYGRKAYSAGESIATMAREGLNDSVSKIQDYIEGRIDGQLRIRPVLDLSDITAGTRQLNGMLGTRSLSVVGSIGKVQNGGNRELVNAIKALGDNLGGSSGDTYNINGITYDDGSNVQTAVATLVRAARIERRR